MCAKILTHGTEALTSFTKDSRCKQPLSSQHSRHPQPKIESTTSSSVGQQATKASKTCLHYDTCKSSFSSWKLDPWHNSNKENTGDQKFSDKRIPHISQCFVSWRSSRKLDISLGSFVKSLICEQIKKHKKVAGLVYKNSRKGGALL